MSADKRRRPQISPLTDGKEENNIMKQRKKTAKTEIHFIPEITNGLLDFIIVYADEVATAQIAAGNTDTATFTWFTNAVPRGKSVEKIVINLEDGVPQSVTFAAE